MGLFSDADMHPFHEEPKKAAKEPVRQVADRAEDKRYEFAQAEAIRRLFRDETLAA